MNSVVAILFLLLSWVVWAMILTGLGAWRWRLHRGEQRSFGAILETFWCGLATLFAVLQVWHFVAPVNGTAQGMVMAVGLLAFFAQRSRLLAIVRSLPRARLWKSLLALAIIAAWLANRATGPNAEYDAGLYHIAAIKWTKLYAIVPGLANLHMRFGFSSTVTLFSALVDQGAWAGHASHVVNGFLLCALAVMIVRSAARILTGTREHADWLLIFCGAFVTDWGLDVQAGSYSTDIGVAVVTILAAYYFLRAFSLPRDGATANSAALVCIVLAAAAITAKASAIFLVAPMALIQLILHRRYRGWAFTGATLLILPWLGRQVVLSGYPLYPSEALAVPVDWQVPFEKTRWLRRVLFDYARWFSYDDSRADTRWVKTWFLYRVFPGTMIWKFFIPTIVAILAAIVVTVRRRWNLRSGAAWLLGCVVVAIVGWYISSPDPRYASQTFCLLMAVLLAMSADRKCYFVAALVFAAAPLFCGRWFWVAPAPSGLFHPTPTSQVMRITTPEGVAVYVPVPETADGFEDRVWDAPLPGAPLSEVYVREVEIPPLRLRRSADLQGGFFRQ